MSKHKRVLQQHRANRKKKKYEESIPGLLEAQPEPIDVGVALTKHKLLFKGTTSASSSALYGNISSASSTVYAEIEFQALRDIFAQFAPLRSDQVFVDLGSGCGKAVIAAALLGRFKKLIGYEIVPALHELAVNTMRRYKSIAGSGTPVSAIQFLQTDFLSSEAIAQWSREANMILLFWTCFELDFVARVREQLELVKAGTIVIATTHQLVSDSFQLLFEFSAKNSCGITAFFIYRRLLSGERKTRRLERKVEGGMDACLFDINGYFNSVEKVISQNSNDKEFWSNIQQQMLLRFYTLQREVGSKHKSDALLASLLSYVIERTFRTVMVMLGEQENANDNEESTNSSESQNQVGMFSREFLDLIVSLQKVTENEEGSKLIADVAAILNPFSLPHSQTPLCSSMIPPVNASNLLLWAWNLNNPFVSSSSAGASSSASALSLFSDKEVEFVRCIEECMHKKAVDAVLMQHVCRFSLNTSFVLHQSAVDSIVATAARKPILLLNLSQPRSFLELPPYPALLPEYVAHLLHANDGRVIVVGGRQESVYPIWQHDPISFINAGHAEDCILMFCSPAAEHLITVLGCLTNERWTGQTCLFVGEEGDGDVADILGAISAGLSRWKVTNSLNLPSWPGNKHFLFTLSRIVYAEDSTEEERQRV